MNGFYLPEPMTQDEMMEYEQWLDQVNDEAEQED